MQNMSILTENVCFKKTGVSNKSSSKISLNSSAVADVSSLVEQSLDKLRAKARRHEQSMRRCDVAGENHAIALRQRSASSCASPKLANVCSVNSQVNCYFTPIRNNNISNHHDFSSERCRTKSMCENYYENFEYHHWCEDSKKQPSTTLRFLSQSTDLNLDEENLKDNTSGE